MAPHVTLFGERPRLQQIEASSHFPLRRVLFIAWSLITIIWMIFNKGMIIRCKTMNRGKIFASFRNIEDIV